MLGQLGLARFHRSAGNEHHRDVQAQRCHQHAGGDLVAVADAHQRVGTVRVDHVLHGVGDDLAAGQRIQHAVVAHRDAVVHGDGVEFLGDAADLLDLARDQLAEVLQVHVAGHELGEGVGDGDDRLVEVSILHAGGAPQGAGAGHVAAGGGGAGTVFGHGWRNGRAVRRGGQPIMANFFGCCCNHLHRLQRLGGPRISPYPRAFGAPPLNNKGASCRRLGCARRA